MKTFFTACVVLASLSAILTRTASGAAADPEKGKTAFQKCAACHSVDDTKSDGPRLKGVFGRKAASLDDYRYSAAMTRSEIVWDAKTLDAYIADPQGYIRGNRMTFSGISDPEERADLIAYLEQATKARDQQ